MLVVLGLAFLLPVDAKLFALAIDRSIECEAKRRPTRGLNHEPRPRHLKALWVKFYGDAVPADSLR